MLVLSAESGRHIFYRVDFEATDFIKSRIRNSLVRYKQMNVKEDIYYGGRRNNKHVIEQFLSYISLENSFCS